MFESTVAVKADGTATSAAFAPKIPGTYRWIAGYSGDANNGPAMAACNDANESVVVTVAAVSAAVRLHEGRARRRLS